VPTGALKRVSAALVFARTRMLSRGLLHRASTVCYVRVAGLYCCSRGLLRAPPRSLADGAHIGRPAQAAAEEHRAAAKEHGAAAGSARVAARVRARGRSVGLLVVKVVEAEGLKKMDTFGKSDPFVEMYTQAQQMEKTARPSPNPTLSPNPSAYAPGLLRGARCSRWRRRPHPPKRTVTLTPWESGLLCGAVGLAAVTRGRQAAPMLPASGAALPDLALPGSVLTAAVRQPPELLRATCRPGRNGARASAACSAWGLHARGADALAR